MTQDATAWTKHYSHGYGQREGPPLWEVITTSLLDQGITPELAKLESSVVCSTLERGQPIIPYWSAIMLPEFAHDMAELKNFVDSNGSLSLQLLVPSMLFETYIDGADWIPDDVPCKHSLTHAHAAVMHTVTVNNTVYTFDESLNTVHHDDWHGLTLRQLLGWRKDFMKFFAFKVLVARPMKQVLLNLVLLVLCVCFLLPPESC